MVSAEVRGVQRAEQTLFPLLVLYLGLGRSECLSTHRILLCELAFHNKMYHQLKCPLMPCKENGVREHMGKNWALQIGMYKNRRESIFTSRHTSLAFQLNTEKCWRAIGVRRCKARIYLKIWLYSCEVDILTKIASMICLSSGNPGVLCFSITFKVCLH